jgi:hypothetical protein
MFAVAHPEVSRNKAIAIRRKTIFLFREDDPAASAPIQKGGRE